MSTFNTKNKLVDATLSGRSCDCRIILARFYTGHTCMQARVYILPFSWHNPTHNNEVFKVILEFAVSENEFTIW